MTAPATVDVLGTAIDNIDLDEATDRVVGLARSGSPHLVVTANVDHLMTLRRDEGFRQAYDAASLRLADGAPLLAVSRLCRTPLTGRVTGADLMPTVAAAAERHGLRVFVLGGTPEVAAAAAARLRSLHPALVLDHSSPPLGFDADLLEDRRALAALRAFRPDIVFVCVGAPRSEKWVASHLHHLTPGAVLCVGAAVDFVAGAKSRAPTLLQRLGLEWAYRLAQEPGRLWRRYLLTDSRFLVLAAMHVVRRRSRRHTWVHRHTRRVGRGHDETDARMTADPKQERLDQVQDDIDEARRQAEDHGTLPPETPPRTFADPDGDGEVEGTGAPPPPL